MAMELSKEYPEWTRKGSGRGRLARGFVKHGKDPSLEPRPWHQSLSTPRSVIAANKGSRRARAMSDKTLQRKLRDSQVQGIDPDPHVAAEMRRRRGQKPSSRPVLGRRPGTRIGPDLTPGVGDPLRARGPRRPPRPSKPRDDLGGEDLAMTGAVPAAPSPETKPLGGEPDDISIAERRRELIPDEVYTSDSGEHYRYDAGTGQLLPVIRSTETGEWRTPYGKTDAYKVSQRKRALEKEYEQQTAQLKRISDAERMGILNSEEAAKFREKITRGEPVVLPNLSGTTIIGSPENGVMITTDWEGNVVKMIPVVEHDAQRLEINLKKKADERKDRESKDAAINLRLEPAIKMVKEHHDELEIGTPEYDAKVVEIYKSLGRILQMIQSGETSVAPTTQAEPGKGARASKPEETVATYNTGTGRYTVGQKWEGTDPKTGKQTRGSFPHPGHKGKSYTLEQVKEMGIMIIGGK